MNGQKNTRNINLGITIPDTFIGFLRCTLIQVFNRKINLKNMDRLSPTILCEYTRELLNIQGP